MCEERPGTFALRLANGREVVTTSAEEIYNFYASNGASLTAKPNRKGGKSKGARNKTKPAGKKVA